MKLDHASYALNIVCVGVFIFGAVREAQRDRIASFYHSGPQVVTSTAKPYGHGDAVFAVKGERPWPTSTVARDAATCGGPSAICFGYSVTTKGGMPTGGSTQVPAQQQSRRTRDTAPRVTGGGHAKKFAALAAKEEGPWRNADVSTEPTEASIHAVKTKPVTQSAASNAPPRTTDQPSPSLQRTSIATAASGTMTTTAPTTVRDPAAYGSHGEVFRRGNEWVTQEQVEAEEARAWRIVGASLSTEGPSTAASVPTSKRMASASIVIATLATGATVSHPRLVTPPRPPSEMEWTATVPIDPALVPAEATMTWWLWSSANIGGGVSASEHAIPLPVGVLADYSALAMPSLCFTDGAGRLLDCIAAGAHGNRLPFVFAGYEECTP